MPTTNTTSSSMLNKATHLAEDAAASVHDMTARSLDRAKEMSTAFRDRAYNAGTHTVGYVREQPLKSVLIAVAAGAAIAVIARMLSGPGSRYD
jgi:ElaB/YqjD/DUF883 family membrane-anchored ribosome-binding protein